MLGFLTQQDLYRILYKGVDEENDGMVLSENIYDPFEYGSYIKRMNVALSELNESNLLR